MGEEKKCWIETKTRGITAVQWKFLDFVVTHVISQLEAILRMNLGKG